MTNVIKTFVWTEARVDTLRQLAGTMSATLIANEIGDGCTRNAVVGKSRRNNIALGKCAPDAEKRRVTAAAPVRLPPPIATRKPKREPVQASQQSVQAESPIETISRLTCFDPGDRPTIELAGLRNTSCRWPFGDHPPLRYCGVDTGAVLDSYCRAHAALAYNATKARAA